jgi:type VI secretion system protein ImpG
MDPRLLEFYNLELQHLREMGKEFADHFPKIAARLGMSGLEVADPYVERLLEGVGFLAARVQLKLHAEFPRFTQALLEIVYPHYLAPTPSMLVAQIKPDLTEPSLATGTRAVPRGSTLRGLLVGDAVTACEFRTAHDVTLWPIELASASYFSFAPDLPLNALPIGQRIQGGLRIRLKSATGIPFSKMALDRLRFYLAGADGIANKLYELCLGANLGTLVLPAKSPKWHELLKPGNTRAVGFADDEALLPVTLRSFQGYRLLQEYFAFPQRFRFFEISGLAPAVKRADTDELELVVLLHRGEPTFEGVIDASNFALYCTPAINLLHKRTDRVHVSDNVHEYHVVPDRTRPMDFEIFEVTEVVGHGVGADSEQRFYPFYSAHADQTRHTHTAYFTTRREPRLPSSAQKRRGPRSTYIGTEVFVSLVDSEQAPFKGDLRQLSLQAWCTNRDLVLLMPIGVGKTDLSLDISAPVTGIRIINGPSRPRAPLVDGAISWRAINHLSLNYLSLVNSTPAEGASALRTLLDLYVPQADPSAKRQVEGIRSVNVTPVVRRLPATGPIAFGRGLEIVVTIDEMAYEGGSAYLAGAVFSQYFSRHASINSFTETVLRSEHRGEVSRWMPQWGARPTL